MINSFEFQQVNKFSEDKNIVDNYNKVLSFATNFAEKGGSDDFIAENPELKTNETYRILVNELESNFDLLDTLGIKDTQLIKIAKLLIALEKYELAEKFFQLGLENGTSEEKRIEITYQLGLLYKNDLQKDLPKANEYFKKALNFYNEKLKNSDYKEPELVNTILKLAEKDLKDNDVTYSIYKELFDFFPHDMDYKEKYADHILENNDSRYWDEAEAIYHELLKLYSYENNSWIKLAQLYEKKGDKKKAEETYKEGIKKSKHFSLLYLDYAEFLVRQNKKKEAIKVYESLIKENKWEKDYYIEIAEEKIELLSGN